MRPRLRRKVNHLGIEVSIRLRSQCGGSLGLRQLEGKMNHYSENSKINPQYCGL